MPLFKREEFTKKSQLDQPQIRFKKLFPGSSNVNLIVLSRKCLSSSSSSILCPSPASSYREIDEQVPLWTWGSHRSVGNMGLKGNITSSSLSFGGSIHVMGAIHSRFVRSIQQARKPRPVNWPASSNQIISPSCAISLSVWNVVKYDSSVNKTSLSTVSWENHIRFKKIALSVLKWPYNQFITYLSSPLFSTASSPSIQQAHRLTSKQAHQQAPQLLNPSNSFLIHWSVDKAPKGGLSSLKVYQRIKASMSKNQSTASHPSYPVCVGVIPCTRSRGSFPHFFFLPARKASKQSIGSRVLSGNRDTSFLWLMDYWLGYWWRMRGNEPRRTNRERVFLRASI